MVFFFFLGFGSTLISRMILNLRGVNRAGPNRSIVYSLDAHPPPITRPQRYSNRAILSQVKFPSDGVSSGVTNSPIHESAGVYFGSPKHGSQSGRERFGVSFDDGVEHFEMLSGPPGGISRSKSTRIGGIPEARRIGGDVGKETVVVVVRQETESRVDYEESHELSDFGGRKL